jgi:hypothetical protein
MMIDDACMENKNGKALKQLKLKVKYRSCNNSRLYVEGTSHNSMSQHN